MIFFSKFYLQGRDVLISELDVGDPVPIHSQIARIMDNEKIGINISNRGRRTLVIEKTGIYYCSLNIILYISILFLFRSSYCYCECLGECWARCRILHKTAKAKICLLVLQNYTTFFHFLCYINKNLLHTFICLYESTLIVVFHRHLFTHVKICVECNIHINQCTVIHISSA